MRAEVDKAKRAAIGEARGTGHCTSCGTTRDNYTAGCKACWSRRRNQQRRGNPEYLAAQRERQRRTRKSRAKVKAPA